MHLCRSNVCSGGHFFVFCLQEHGYSDMNECVGYHVEMSGTLSITHFEAYFFKSIFWKPAVSIYPAVYCCVERRFLARMLEIWNGDRSFFTSRELWISGSDFSMWFIV